MINKVTLIGRLGKDAEVKTFENESHVINFTLATSETYKDKQGEKKEQTEWHNVALFSKSDKIAEYLKKSVLVFVEGKLKTRSYESNGEKRYITEVVINPFTGMIKILEFAKDKEPSKIESASNEDLDNIVDNLPF